MNLIIVVGRLGRDPELTHTRDGKAVAKFSIAVQDDSGKNKEPLWLNIIAWEKLAEICHQYLTKGREVLVRGRLSIRDYESKGERKTATEVVAEKVRFFGSGEKNEAKPAPAGNRTGRGSSSSAPEIDDEDMPF